MQGLAERDDRALRRRPRGLQQRRRRRPAPTPGSARWRRGSGCMGVNFWGVVHGCRAFLPHLSAGGTSSTRRRWPGCPGSGPATTPRSTPSWRSPRTSTTRCMPPACRSGSACCAPAGSARDRRRRPQLAAPSYGASPDDDPANAVIRAPHRAGPRRGAQPASVADAVADAVTTGRFWVIPHQDFLDLCIERWALSPSARIRSRPSTCRHATALADPRRGRRRARPRRAGLTAADAGAARWGTLALTPPPRRGIMDGDRSPRPAVRTDSFEEVRNHEVFPAHGAFSSGLSGRPSRSVDGHRPVSITDHGCAARRHRALTLATGLVHHPAGR